MTRTMQDLIKRMVWVESQHREGCCDNIEKSSTHPSTAGALVRHGLAEEVTCPIDWDTVELRLTNAGRAEGGA